MFRWNTPGFQTGRRVSECTHILSLIQSSSHATPLTRERGLLRREGLDIVLASDPAQPLSYSGCNPADNAATCLSRLRLLSQQSIGLSDSTGVKVLAVRDVIVEAVMGVVVVKWFN